MYIWKGVCFANEGAKGIEKIVKLLSSSDGMTQREISAELSASERTVRFWISKLRKSGKLVLEWGDDLRVPRYLVAPAGKVSEGAV